jgi:Calcineurin-like phosphoesterase
VWTSLSQIVKEAMKVKCQVFSELVDDATHLLCEESGKVGNLEVLGRLVKINPTGEALVIGDLHGDLESLVDILKGSKFLQKMDQSDDALLIFLGDYGDRGLFSAEVYYTVLSLKLLFPEKVVLMRGNHEGPRDLLAHPHDLPEQFQNRFGETWNEAYSETRRLFECMHNAAIVEERYLLIHGGLPQKASTIEDLAYAHAKHPKQPLLEEMLWNDPSEIIEEACASPRGAGKLFGENITNSALEKLNVKVLIRGHEPCQEGYKIDHNGKVLTLFSRKGSPYFNAYGAYLNVGLSEKLENAQQLIPYIHQF